MPLFGIIIGLIPGFAWLLFYLKEDLHPEPKKLIALTFINGAAFAFITLVVQIGLKTLFDRLGFGTTSFTWLFAFAAAEEIFKFWAAYAAVRRDPEFDEPEDAMMYCIVAALGFATVENVGVLMGGPPGSFLLTSVFPLITFRFLGATLLHTLTAGVIGYYWAEGIRAFRASWHILYGLAMATILHGMFNYLILHYEAAGIPIVFLVVVGLFVLAGFERLRRRML